MKANRFAFTRTLFCLLAVLQLPAHSKVIHLACKTQEGKAVTYYVDIDKEVVKSADDDGAVETFRTVLFTPTAIEFDTPPPPRWMAEGLPVLDVAFKYQINRSTLDYLVDMFYVDNGFAGQYRRSRSAGKCKVVKVPSVQF